MVYEKKSSELYTTKKIIKKQQQEQKPNKKNNRPAKCPQRREVRWRENRRCPKRAARTKQQPNQLRNQQQQQQSQPAQVQQQQQMQRGAATNRKCSTQRPGNALSMVQYDTITNVSIRNTFLYDLKSVLHSIDETYSEDIPIILYDN